MQRALILQLLLSIPYCQHLYGFASEQAIVEIELNSERKGEYVVQTGPESDFLLEPEDLKRMGFRNPEGKIVRLDGKDYVSLRSMQKVRYELDEVRLLLKISADPALLGETQINFLSSRSFKISYPHDSSLFINYGMRYGASKGLGDSSFTATQESGMRIGDLLFLSNETITHSEGKTRTTRLMTSITRDDRQKLRRLIIGDLYTSSGQLGSTLLLGGIGFSKSYSIEPSFQKQPALDYAGFVALPSQVDVLVDGVRIRTEKLSPGEFNLQNIPVDAGLHGLELRIRDALGREQSLTIPYYSSEALLRRGFHDYSYSAGFLRSRYGTESNRYGSLAFSSYHRYGLNSDITIGFQAEGSARMFNAGPRVTARLGRFGIADIGIALSNVKNMGRGQAAFVNHNFQSKQVSVRFQASGYSKNYRSLSNLSSVNDRLRLPQYSFGAGISRGSRKWGSVSLDASILKQYIGNNQESYAITYSKTMWKKLTVSTTYQRVYRSRPDNQVFLSLNFFLPHNVNMSASYRREENSRAEVMQISKNPPEGKGFSYRAMIKRGSDSVDGNISIDPYVQYNGKYGVYAAEYNTPIKDDSSSGDCFEISAAGSLVYAAGVWGASRPVDDSFAIVRTESIKGVRVYYNNHEIDRTDMAGKVVIPSLNAYVDNVVAISDQDIPVNYMLKDVTRYISPSWRSGTLVDFAATRIQAITGKLRLRLKNGEHPVEFAELMVSIGEEILESSTGRDGEFYLENVPEGDYSAHFEYERQNYSFKLKIPKSDQMLVDLGVVTVGQTD